MNPFLCDSDLSPRPKHALPRPWLHAKRIGQSAIDGAQTLAARGMAAVGRPRVPRAEQPDAPLRVTPAKRKQNDAALDDSGVTKWRRGFTGRVSTTPHAWRSPTSPSPVQGRFLAGIDLSDSPSGVAADSEPGAQSPPTSRWAAGLNEELARVHVSTPQRQTTSTTASSGLPDITPVRKLQEALRAALLDRADPALNCWMRDKIRQQYKEIRTLRVQLVAARTEVAEPNPRHQELSASAAARLQAAPPNDSATVNDEALRTIAQLQRELYEANTKLKLVTAEREELRAERDELKIERDELRTERDELRTERDELRTEHDELRAERDKFTAACQFMCEQLPAGCSWNDLSFSAGSLSEARLAQSSPSSPSSVASAGFPSILPSLLTSGAALSQSLSSIGLPSARSLSPYPSSVSLSPSGTRALSTSAHSDASEDVFASSNESTSSYTDVTQTTVADELIEFDGIRLCRVPPDFVTKMDTGRGVARYKTMVICRDCLMAEEGACLIEKCYVSLAQHIAHTHTPQVSSEHFLHRADCPLPANQVKEKDDGPLLSG